MQTLSLRDWLSPSDCQDSPLYLVGGTVRDLLMGSVPKDIDLVCRNAKELAVSIARRRNAAFVPMEKKSDEPCYRIVDRDKPGYFLDIAEMRGETIHEDLTLRDFTINAIAMEISGEGIPGDVIDPLHGAEDIRNRLIRIPHDKAFVADPLRVLRAFRFAASLGFSIDSATQGEMRESIAQLAHVSVERIMSELVCLLRIPQSTQYFRQMDAAGILDVIFPEIAPMKTCPQNGFHHLNVWDHSLLVMENCENILNNLPLFFGERSRDVSENLAGSERFPLLKLTALLHDLGKPSTRGMNEQNGRITFYGHDDAGARMIAPMAERLKVSRRSREFIVLLVAEHLRVLHLASGGAKQSTVMKWFRRVGDDSIPAIILSMADVMGILGPDATDAYRESHITWAKKIIPEYFGRIKMSIERADLVTGRDLISLGMGPGPSMGKVLDRVRTAQDAGQVTSREEALSLARSLISPVSPTTQTD